MILTEKNRIEAFTKKGWWGEETLYSLFKDALTSCGDQEALVDPENRKDITGDLPKRYHLMILTRLLKDMPVFSLSMV